MFRAVLISPCRSETSVISAMALLAQMANAGILPSMGSKGSAHDNAVAESFFSNLKNELIHHENFLSRESARTAIFSYIELFYNRQRIHQTLGYVSPVAFELATSEVSY